MVVEKMLAAEGVSRLELGREAFEERVWAWKREYGDFITGQMRRMGASCDWTRERFTLDSQLSGESPPAGPSATMLRQMLSMVCLLRLDTLALHPRLPAQR
jgi:valyl-tRNA synthetase